MVISRSIAQIVEEMNEYLQYYEEEIEKGFAGANTMEEWDRIHGTVIRPFLDTLGSESNIDSHEKRMSLIGTLIVDWNNFERERAQTLSEQAIR